MLRSRPHPHPDARTAGAAFRGPRGTRYTVPRHRPASRSTSRATGRHPSMHIIQSSSTMRRAALAAALCLCTLLATCGREQAADIDTGAAAADSVPTDTSAMAVARRALGPEVRMAIPFRIQHRTARFVAAAIPIMAWVPDLARSGNSVGPGHEMVIVESTPESHAVHKPG